MNITIFDTLDISDCENIGESLISFGNSTDSGNNERVSFTEMEPPRATLANNPKNITNALSYKITIGGIGVVSYIYSLNDGDWSDEIPVEAPLTFDISSKTRILTEIVAAMPAGAPPGLYNVRVINKNGVSRIAETPYTVTETSLPVPVVTAVTPPVLPTGSPATIMISGENFGETIAAVNLILTRLTKH